MLLCVAGFLVATSQQAGAQATYFWRSEASSGNWQSGTGTVWWNSGASATALTSNPATPVVLEWANNNILSQTNNTSGQVIHGFRLLVGASSARTFQGGHIRFTNNGTSSPFILHAGTPTHTISNNIFIAGGGSGNLLRLDINNTGGLIFDGGITNNGNNINLVGSRASAGDDIRFNGVISGSGGFYINNANHVALFGAENTMTGQLTIDAGVARLTNSGSTFGGTSQNIRIADGTTLDLNNVSTTVGTVAERGSGNSGSVHLGSATLTVTGNDTNLFQGNISGTGGSLVKQGTHTLSLFGSQTYSGSTTVEDGVLATSAALATTALTITGGSFNANGADIIGDGVAVTVNGGAYNVNGSDTIGALSGSGGTVTVTNDATLTTTVTGTSSFAGSLAGAGGFAKAGEGTLTLSGSSANTLSGLTTVSDGTLDLAKSGGDAIAGDVSVGSGATLLISSSNQVADSSAVTLSGGTLRRGGAVSDVMGDLDVASASTIDYGTFAGSTFLQFGSVTGGENLTINSFLIGNQFLFSAADFGAGEAIADSFSFTDSVAREYSFSDGTFTITAIPEPSTVVAALGLAGLMLWPARRRLLKDAKSILGLRPAGIDRARAYRHS